MQRDDQPVMNYYHRVCREAAKRKMLVDFHGAQRPALLTRTWPNLLSTEGVKGLENDKWSTDIDPEHDATLPFTRMYLGPMDYTPGAMVNAARKSFAPIFEAPMSQGTRAHQLSLYVVYESPLQMLADSPSNYTREPEIMESLGPVPSVWDETRVLQAKIGDYAALARRRGRDWWIGALTDWTSRELTPRLVFPARGLVWARRLRGRAQRRPLGQRLSADEEPRGPQPEADGEARARRGLGGPAHPGELRISGELPAPRARTGAARRDRRSGVPSCPRWRPVSARPCCGSCRSAGSCCWRRRAACDGRP